MSNRPILTLACALALAAALSACAATPFDDERFGDSVRATTASQIIDPAASRNPDPVAGIDGRAAQAAQERYEESFTSPAPTASALTIGIGK